MDRTEQLFYVHNIIQDEEKRQKELRNSLEFIGAMIAPNVIQKLHQAEEEPEAKDEQFEETLANLDVLDKELDQYVDQIKVYPIKE